MPARSSACALLGPSALGWAWARGSRVRAGRRSSIGPGGRAAPPRPGGPPPPRLEVRSLAEPRLATEWERIVAAAREVRPDLLLVDWDTWANPQRQPFGSSLDEIARLAPCDVAAVKRGGLARVRQVLLPVRGGPQGLLTLRLAMALAERHDATITLLHVEQPGLPPEDDAAVRAQLDALLARGAHPARAQPAITIAGSVEAAIAVEAEAHQVTIMGASPGDPGTPLLLGPVAEAVAARVSGTLIIVKARE